jgi:hypothetical protein
MAAKTVETFRTTKWLRALVRRAAKLEQKRPSEFLRQAAEEKAKQVIREHERARLKRLLAELPPGNLTDEEAARLGDEIRHEVSSSSEPRPAPSGRSGPRAGRPRAS